MFEKVKEKILFFRLENSMKKEIKNFEKLLPYLNRSLVKINQGYYEEEDSVRHTVYSNFLSGMLLKESEEDNKKIKLFFIKQRIIKRIFVQLANDITIDLAKIKFPKLIYRGIRFEVSRDNWTQNLVISIRCRYRVLPDKKYYTKAEYQKALDILEKAVESRALLRVGAENKPIIIL